jgi:hypothetical protein
MMSAPANPLSFFGHPNLELGFGLFPNSSSPVSHSLTSRRASFPASRLLMPSLIS